MPSPSAGVPKMSLRQRIFHHPESRKMSFLARWATRLGAPLAAAAVAWKSIVPDMEMVAPFISNLDAASTTRMIIGLSTVALITAASLLTGRAPKASRVSRLPQMSQPPVATSAPAPAPAAPRIPVPALGGTPAAPAENSPRPAVPPPTRRGPASQPVPIQPGLGIDPASLGAQPAAKPPIPKPPTPAAKPVAAPQSPAVKPASPGSMTMERAQVIFDNQAVFSPAEVAEAKRILESDRTSMLPSQNIVPTEAQVVAMIQAGQFVEAANGYRLMGRLDEADKIQFLLNIRELHVISDTAKQSGRADDYLKVVEKAKLILAQQVPDAKYKQKIEKALTEWERMFEEESKTSQFSFAGLSEILTEILTEDDISTQILRDINVAQVAPQPAPTPAAPPVPAPAPQPAPKPAEEIQPSSETQVGDPVAMLIAKLAEGELKTSLMKAGNDKKAVRRILESTEDAEIEGAENEFDAAYEIVKGA